MKLTLEEHYSIDKPKSYYYIYVDNFAIYSCSELADAEERLELIKEIGLKQYIERIRIQKNILSEIELPDISNVDEEEDTE